jgi:3-isopropylmalate/(R)-2-methylmalate dehydratase small subunit
MTWTYSGRAHTFGDGVPLDDGFIPFRLAIGRVTDPAALIPHLFEDVRPGFAERAQAGDVVIGGADFAAGKPHAQGFIALQAMGIGMICESMPYNSLRAGVSSGLAFMTGCTGVAQMFEDGDGIEADFATGRVRNLRSGEERAFPPLDPSLRRIIAAGGSAGLLRQWWAGRQGTAAAAAAAEGGA